MSFANWCHTLRAHHRLGQTEAAEKLGITRQYLWRIENGRVDTVGIGLLVRIAETYGRSPYEGLYAFLNDVPIGQIHGMLAGNTPASINLPAVRQWGPTPDMSDLSGAPVEIPSVDSGRL